MNAPDITSDQPDDEARPSEREQLDAERGENAWAVKEPSIIRQMAAFLEAKTFRLVRGDGRQKARNPFDSDH